MAPSCASTSPTTTSTTSCATSPPTWRRRSREWKSTRHRLEELFRDARRSRPWLSRAPRARSTTSATSGTRARASGATHAIRDLFTYLVPRGVRARTRTKVEGDPDARASTLVFLPAIGQIVVGVGRTDGRASSTTPNLLEFTAFFLALFAAAQAPELIVTDKQHGALSLYLSRPIRGADYALAKIGALTAAMLVITLGPQLLLFARQGRSSAATPWAALKGEVAEAAVRSSAARSMTSCSSRRSDLADRRSRRGAATRRRRSSCSSC